MWKLSRATRWETVIHGIQSYKTLPFMYWNGPSSWLNRSGFWYGRPPQPAPQQGRCIGSGGCARSLCMLWKAIPQHYGDWKSSRKKIMEWDQMYWGQTLKIYLFIWIFDSLRTGELHVSHHAVAPILYHFTVSKQCLNKNFIHSILILLGRKMNLEERC